MVIFLKGGFGNNLFQILEEASQLESCELNGYFLKPRWITKLFFNWTYHETSLLEDVFHVSYRRPSPLEFLFILYIWVARFLNLDIEKVSFLGIKINFGYFQNNVKIENLDVIRNILINKIGISKPSNTLAVHRRLGDFVDLGISLADQYYISAVNQIEENSGPFDKIDLISNAKESILFNEEIIMPNTLQSLKEDFKTLCSSNALVISNSTLSLWAAVVGGASNVIAPKSLQKFQYMMEKKNCRFI